MRAREVVALLGLEPLPQEGGLWTQVWRDDHGTAIYFLLTPEQFSAFHRLDEVEIWHHYMGAPVTMILLEPDGAVVERVLGDHLEEGERPCIVVPAGVWMGAETTGDWSLVGTTMMPPWEPNLFEVADRDGLTRKYPSARGDILRLTRRLT